MTFLDWFILSLLKVLLLFVAAVAFSGASTVALILLIRDCTVRR